MPAQADVATASVSNADVEASVSDESSRSEALAGADVADCSVDPNFSRAPVFNEAVERKLTEGGDEKAEEARRRGCRANIKALAISAFLFSFITIVQVFAARIAHSQALLMDCISMGVDAFTYMGNIVVECRKRDGGDHVRSQLLVVACSLSCLIYFTVDAAKESWGTIQVCRGVAEAAGPEDDVNGYITLAFALGGVVFDAMCLLAFYRSNKQTGSARHVNMFSALLHVGADCLRSTSTLVMSLLILWAGYDSTCLDAYTSLFIGFTIIAGASTGLISWLKLLLRYCGCLRERTAQPSARA